MKTFKDHFSTASDHYRKFRPDYPEALFQYLASISPKQQQALDVGCGNGQASLALSQFFSQVDACDASAEQIKNAATTSNLQYHVNPAEALPAADNSVDLVTVAQAIHWFEHHAFFNEVERVLKPGGVFACWGYELLHTNTELDAVIRYIHSTVLADYWPPERALLEQRYGPIPFPYPAVATPSFNMQALWSLDHLMGYLNTWSAVKAYQKQRDINPIEEHRAAIVKAWGAPQKTLTIIWPLILFVGKKSLQASTA